MMRSIKISEINYLSLQRLQGPRESYNDVINRLIKIQDTVAGIRDVLGPAHPLTTGELLCGVAEKHVFGQSLAERQRGL